MSLSSELRHDVRRFISLTLLMLFPVAVMAQRPFDPGTDAVTTCDLVVRSEITIDRPVAEVWPHFLDMGSWMSGIRFQHIRGRDGEEGEVRRVTEGGGSPYGSYFITTVRVTPLERYVVRVASEGGGDYFGFAAFSFSAAGNKTHLIYDIYLELRQQGQTAARVRQSCEEQHAITRQEVSRNNQNLKSLVESEGRSTSAAE